MRRYTSFNTLPRHAINVLLDYAVCHNMTVRHSFIQFKMLTHLYSCIAGWQYEPRRESIRWTILTMDAIVPESSEFMCGWVNGNDYELAHKTFGMIQLLPVFSKPLGMLEFNEAFAHEYSIRHKFIAESQGTLMAILPVHTRGT
jgi:hypothetical protein